MEQRTEGPRRRPAGGFGAGHPPGLDDKRMAVGLLSPAGLGAGSWAPAAAVAAVAAAAVAAAAVAAWLAAAAGSLAAGSLARWARWADIPPGRLPGPAGTAP
jgi:hypothetical protein